jgi:hypothetical protein
VSEDGELSSPQRRFFLHYSRHSHMHVTGEGRRRGRGRGVGGGSGGWGEGAGRAWGGRRGLGLHALDTSGAEGVLHTDYLGS